MTHHPSSLTVSLVVVLTFLSSLVSPSLAEIPQLITYQGKVTDTGGVPVSDGDYAMTFTIYDAETSGTSMWSSGALTVAVSSGVFSALLGESPQPTLNLDFDIDYWFEIDIAGDVQSPRQRLGSVGYAYMASGIVPGTGVDGALTWPTLAVTNNGTGDGLYGESALGTGVRGVSNATNGRGVYGIASAGIGTNYGVYGETSSTDGFAGYFEGRAQVTGDLTVTSGGKVGIGVTSPENPLVISGAESDTAGTGAQLRIHDSTNSNHAFSLRIGASGNNNLNLDSYWGGWQTLMTIDRQTGRVGIGTDTPDRDLSVVGYVRASNDIDETEYVEIHHGGGNGLINWNGDGNLDIRYANSAKVTVQQDGSVGIGTTSPGATLDVRGSTVFNEDGGDFDFRVESDTRQNMIFVDASTDRVAIGTATPNATLDVRGDAIFNEAGNDYDFRVEGDTEQNLLFLDASTDRVGIGTAAPAAMLDVRGGSRDVGVRGETAASSGWGVYGYATYAGNYSVGVHGETTSTGGVGVYGTSPGGYGVYGRVTASTGDAIGVYGTSPMGFGVYGTATAGGIGVYGVAPSGYGVHGMITGTSDYGVAVYGNSETTWGAGVYGMSKTIGVRGNVEATATTYYVYGVLGEIASTMGYGVYGQASAYDADYGVYSYGNTGATGTKSAIVKTSDHGWRHLYAMESPEVLFEDVGASRLTDGEAVVTIDPMFAQTVNLEAGYHVFIQVYGDASVFVTDRTPETFTVRLREGQPDVEFSYRIVAKRLGFEDLRLAVAADPTLAREAGTTPSSAQ